MKKIFSIMLAITLLFSYISTVSASALNTAPSIDQIKAIADKYNVEIFEPKDTKNVLELESIEDFEDLLKNITKESQINDIGYDTPLPARSNSGGTKSVTESFPKSNIWGIPVILDVTILFSYARFQGIPRISNIQHISTVIPGITPFKWNQEYYSATVQDHRYLDVKVYGRYELTVSIQGVTVGTKTDLLPHMLFIDGYKYF